MRRDRIRELLTEAKVVLTTDVMNFIKGLDTWLELDYVSGRKMNYTTRRHGSVGNETPGRKDQEEAHRVGKALTKKFGSAVKWEVGEIDEWTELGIEL